MLAGILHLWIHLYIVETDYISILKLQTLDFRKIKFLVIVSNEINDSKSIYAHY